MSVPRETELQPDEVRVQAIQKLLDAEPMPVDDWPVMKKQMLEDRYASVLRLLDTYD